MTPAEINAECRAITDGMGDRAKVYVSVSDRPDNSEPAYIAFYPSGIGGDNGLAASVSAATFEEAFALLRSQLAEARANHEHKTVNEMALAIIRITLDHGECAASALSMEFADDDIKRLGSEALTLADKMAGNGPFTIVITRGQNAA